MAILRNFEFGQYEWSAIAKDDRKTRQVHEVIGASFTLAPTCEKFLDRNSAALGGNNDFTHFDGILDTWDVDGKR